MGARQAKDRGWGTAVGAVLRFLVNFILIAALVIGFLLIVVGLILRTDSLFAPTGTTSIVFGLILVAVPAVIWWYRRTS